MIQSYESPWTVYKEYVYKIYLVFSMLGKSPSLSSLGTAWKNEWSICLCFCCSQLNELTVTRYMSSSSSGLKSTRSSSCRSHDMALRISGPMSCSVRRPAYHDKDIWNHTHVHNFLFVGFFYKCVNALHLPTTTIPVTSLKKQISYG